LDIEVESAIRPVTDAEVEAFREQGWVELDGLVTQDLAARLLERLQAHMGGPEPAADRLRHMTEDGPHPRAEHLRPMWRDYEDPWLDDELARAVAHSDGLAAVACRLLGRAEVRFWSDEVLAKPPAQAGGAPTAWHQDAPYSPMDREGALAVWIALVDVTPEMGSLRFVTGSHRLGRLGRVLHIPGHDMLAEHPDLLDRLDISPPLHLAAGDATVHDWRTVHGAAANETDRTRWAYTAAYFPADALYTGTPQRRSDGLGLRVNEPFDHQRFPLLRPAGADR
jgi:hypothetical protein